MIRLARTIAITFGVLLAAAGNAQAITFGEFDGNRHPNVGAMVITIGSPPRPATLCSGTLISPTVFLTASHCVDFLVTTLGGDPSDVAVTFDPVFDRATVTLHSGTAHQHPLYGSGGQSDGHDIATIVLDEPVLDRAPAQLPTRNQLAEMALGEEWFTAVGYGLVRTDKREGPNAFTTNNQRNFVTQGFLSLQPAWLNLSMNPSTDNGGACYGDSGGPHFLRDTDLLVSITITGDTPCRATDKTYRTDTDSARAFLDEFVTLP